MCFKTRLKAVFGASLTNNGKFFQNLEAATLKAQSPLCFNLIQIL